GVTLADQTFSTAAINAGLFVNESHPFTIPASTAAGRYNASLIAESQHKVPQSNTNNDGQNNAGVPFTVQAAAATFPYLLPHNVAVSPTTVVAGNTLTVSYTVRNQGGTNPPVSSFPTRRSSDLGVTLADQTFSTAAINAGLFVNESHPFTIPAS